MVDTVFVSSRFSGNATLRDVLNARATLRRGSSGEPVTIVQTALIDLGESMPAGADSIFGNQTHNAVVHYQSTRGLSADGIIGRNTMSRLDSDIAAFDAPVPRPIPSNMLTVAIHGATIQELQGIVLTESYDFGCKPFITPTLDGDYILPALVTPVQYASLRTRERRIDIIFEHLSPDRTAAVTIGQGDRFNSGLIAPRGLGTHPNESVDLGGIMNVDEIDSAIKGLVREYGISTFSLPNPTAEGPGVGGGSVGRINPQDYHIYFTAGVHARERGSPDNLIYFIADLLYAQKHGIGLTYGMKTYSNAHVLRALSTGIVFFPLVNPDGVRFDQKTDSGWRKNRNQASAVPGDDLSIGVDINRNYDFLWSYKTYFDSSTWNAVASNNSNSEKFHGTGPFSEPESRNVRSVFDMFPRLRWYMDIHSAMGVFCYNWGDDNNGTDSLQNFQNQAYDGKRGVLGDDRYREYITSSDLSDVQAVAVRVAGAMSQVEGRSYRDEQSTGAGVASGASDDYAYSRNKVDSSKNKVYGFTMEFGYPMNFYPTLAEFQQNVLDTGAGLMEFCLAAADVGLV
jgi:murein tripeptide amidase MpaA